MITPFGRILAVLRWARKFGKTSRIGPTRWKVGVPRMFHSISRVPRPRVGLAAVSTPFRGAHRFPSLPTFSSAQIRQAWQAGMHVAGVVPSSVQSRPRRSPKKRGAGRGLGPPLRFMTPSGVGIH